VVSQGFTASVQGSPVDCAQPYRPALWLGKPGALTSIQMPNEGYARPLEDHFAVHDLLEGFSTDRAPYGSRTWGLSYEWLRPDAASTLYEFATRQRGFGPFIFIDPHAKNLLSPNQASGTDALHTTEGFAVTGTGESLASSTDWFQQGERSLAWTLNPGAPTFSGLLRLTAPTQLFGWCLPPGGQVAFSGYIKQGIATATDGVTLNANPYFEVDVTNWSTASGTFVRSTANFHEGVASALFTPDGVSSTAEFGSEQVTAGAGVGYKVSAWVYSAATRSINIGVNWYNGSHTLITGQTTSVNVVGSTWTYVSATFLAPLNTAFVQHKIQMTGTPPVTNTLYVDEARIVAPITDITVQLTPRIAFLNGSGAVQSYANGSVINTVTGAAQQFCVTATIPTGTGGVYLEPQLMVTGSSVTGTSIVYIDMLQLELTDPYATTPACTTWEYGQGQPLVGVRVGGESVPRIRRATLDFMIVEVT
jgi:hypothetical protein